MSNETRQVVRKVTPQAVVDFDEFAWPVNCALLVLTGFSVGLVIALSNFDDPRWLYNGWVRLAGVLATLVALVWGMVYLKGGVQRRLQLAVTLSLLAHLVLYVYMNLQYLSPLAVDETLASNFNSPDPVTLPEYHPSAFSDDAPQQDFEKPVETQTPDTAVEEVPRTETRPEEEPDRPEPNEPQAEPTATDVQQLEQQERSPPHRSEQLAGLEVSRRSQPDAGQITDSIPLPEIQDKQEQTKPPEAAPVLVDPQQTDPQIARRTQSESGEMPQTPEVQLDRPNLTASSDTNPAEQELPRRNAAGQLSAEPVESQQANAAADTPEPQLEAAATDMARANVQPDLPAAMETPEAADEPSPDVAMSQPDRAEAAEQTPAPSSAANMARRSAQAVSPDVALDAAAAPTAAESATEALEASDASMERATASNTPTRMAESPAAEAGTAEGAEVALRAPQLNSSVEEAAPGSSRVGLTRQSAAAQTDENLANVPSASPQQSAEATNTLSPSPAAVSRDSSGSPDLVQANNVGRDFPDPSTEGAVASSTARRAESQSAEMGDDASPSPSPSITRSTTGASLPSAALAAEDTANPDTVGSQSPADVDASSTASAQRRAAQAPAASSSAAAGSGNVETGPTQVTTQVQQSSGLGGGEPGAASRADVGRIARRTLPGGQSMPDGAEAPAGSPEASSAGSQGDPSTKPAPGDASGLAGAGRMTPGPEGTSTRPGSPSSVEGGSSAENFASGGESPSRQSLSSLSGTPGRSGSGTVGLRRRTGSINDLAGPDAGAMAEMPTPAGSGEGQPGGTGSPESGVTVGRATPGSGPAQRPAGQPGSPASGNLVGDEVGPPGTEIAAGPLGGRRFSPETPTIGSGERANPGRATVGSLPSDLAEADEPGPIAADLAGPGSSTEPGSSDPGSSASTIARQDTFPVEIAAAPGVGGLAVNPDHEPGVPSLQARPESDLVHNDRGRFLLDRSGARLRGDSDLAENPTPAYKQRDPEKRLERGLRFGATAESELAVEMGLDFLARHQAVGGHWSLHNFATPEELAIDPTVATMQSDTAATGLALLAFLGAGYTHLEGKHRIVVRRGLEFLLANQGANGDLFTGGNKFAHLYSHGIASIALCEAYGMTRDPDLKEPAERALKFIAACQSPDEGGWRYQPRIGSDTSVSGWQLMALKSGELAGLEAPKECYAGVTRWLDHSAGETQGAIYAYRPKSKLDHQNQPSPVMTAEALLMRLYLGWDGTDPRLEEGVEYLRSHRPAFGTVDAPRRNTYYWYYATQLMFHRQGDAWESWNTQLRELLVTSQVKEGPLAGSWHPTQPVPDRWGVEAGRIYVTAMHLLVLEVYYRHLPLYRTLESEVDSAANP